MPIYRNHRTRRYSSPWLREYAFDVTSQSGQDGVLQRIFEVIGTKHRYCVEFGAWDGKYLSNTWNLINNHGWSGTLIEGHPASFADLNTRYAERDDVHTLHRYVWVEGEDSLDSILTSTGAPEDLDLLVIDIDGNDWHVWNALEAFRPRVVQIEYNNTIPLFIEFVQDCDKTLSQGSSLRAFVELGKRKGYELICADCDAFFVRAEDLPKFNLDNDIEVLADAHQTFIWQAYDGQLYISGKRNLTWAGGNLEDEPRSLTYLQEPGR